MQSRLWKPDGETLEEKLEWWNVETGCTKRKEMVKEAWIRVVGLPLHLWTSEIFKRIGDCYGGFMELEKGTSLKTSVLWAQILVRLRGTESPTVTNIEATARRFKLLVWWELLSCVFSSKGKKKR